MNIINQIKYIYANYSVVTVSDHHVLPLDGWLLTMGNIPLTMAQETDWIYYRPGPGTPTNNA